MKYSRYCFIALVLPCICLHNEANAQLIGEFPQGGGPITLTTTDGPVQTFAVDFTAEQGSLSTGESPAPFSFFFNSEPNTAFEDNVILAMFPGEGFIVLDGSVTTQVFASDDALIAGQYALPLALDGENTVHGMLINGYEPPPPPPAPTITASAPLTGGPITLSSGESPDALSSIWLFDLAAADDLHSGGNPAPFDSVEIIEGFSWDARSQTLIMLDGEFTLDVTVSPNANIRGNARGPGGRQSFSVDLVSNVPEPNPQILAAMASFGVLLGRRKDTAD